MSAAPVLSDEEQAYDEVIAPKLLELAHLCRDHGMQFVAVVEYETGSVGLTEQSNLEIAGPQFRLAAYGARCNGNADALITALLKDDKKHAVDGVSKSFYLHRLAKEQE
jgi:hypothetical protein